MLRNIEQIQLEKISEKLNSSAFRQSKDCSNQIKKRFYVASKSTLSDPLGQLTCLSSRDIKYEEECKFIETHFKYKKNIYRWDRKKFLKEYNIEKYNNYVHTRISESD